MAALIILIGIWLTGGFATWGALNAIDLIEGNTGDDKIDDETLRIKFMQSWYAFGLIIMVVLLEIGKKIDEVKEIKIAESKKVETDQTITNEIVDDNVKRNMFGQKVIERDNI